jgi:S1-C subfamily serine protease
MMWGMEDGAVQQPPRDGPEDPPTIPIWGWDPSRAPGTAMGGPPPRRRRGRVVLAAVVAALVLLAGGAGVGWFLTRGEDPSRARSPLRATSPATPSSGQPDQDLDADEVADRVEPAVVNISTVLDANPFDDIPGRGRGAGTGMIVTPNGQVLTNNHVIEGATRIEVTVAGRSGTYVAQFVGAAPDDDVALLQIQGVSGLPTVTLGDSSELEVGQEVIALGNAGGRGGSPTVTEGTISALGRTVTVSDGRGGFERLSGLIQTDAVIRQGVSGGPLVNTAAQVVGIITAGSRTSRSESGSRVGFAIPTSTALSIVNEIRAGRASSSIIVGQPGFLGVEVQELDAATAGRLGLDVRSGVLIVGVTQGTPAAIVGISEGSVITAVNGEPVSSVDELGSALRRHKPGEEVRVTWVDENGTHTGTARLISGPAV